jgi:hypothetical protein
VTITGNTIGDDASSHNFGIKVESGANHYDRRKYHVRQLIRRHPELPGARARSARDRGERGFGRLKYTQTAQCTL